LWLSISALADGGIMSNWSLKNPYMTTISENYILNGEGSRKETRHVVFELGDSGLEYKVGDALGVIAENPPHIVEELIEIQGWDRDQLVTTHNGESDLYSALKKDFEVHLANKKFVNSLTEKIVSTGMKISLSIISRTRNGQEIDNNLSPSSASDDPVSKVAAITSDADAIANYLWTRDYIDIMREFDVRYSAAEFMSLADRLKPRLYSIASSLDAHPGKVELTVGIVRFTYHDRPRGGMCTLYLADEVDMTGKEIGVFMSPTKSFILPEDKSVNIIMVGPGTGIAPFRAFMEQRVHDNGTGKNWLFFGDQSEKTEYYYKEQIESWLNGGDLYKFTTAWSRDQVEKIYVQNRLKENGAEVWQWFEEGAYFYICGDKQRMAKDVHRALIEIAMEHGGMSEEDATFFIEKTMMREQKRYLRDVY
jgi:sulfite reductase (NADPH) flavoprotein alpha-component